MDANCMIWGPSRSETASLQPVHDPVLGDARAGEDNVPSAHDVRRQPGRVGVVGVEEGRLEVVREGLREDKLRYEPGHEEHTSRRTVALPSTFRMRTSRFWPLCLTSVYTGRLPSELRGTV
jgi:hypothetical protein